MRSPTYLILGLLFIAAGIAAWCRLLFPSLPAAGYLRFMIGLVLVLMGLYRCVLAIFPKPKDRPGKGGFHRLFGPPR